MRVTEGSSSYGALVGLQSSASRLADLQSQLSSGRQITKPSDSPTGTAQALNLRGEIKRMDQYQSSANDALGWLTTVDSTLSGTNTQLQKVRELMLQSANVGSNDSTSQATLAQQVDQIRTSLISMANTSYLGRPVFGGTTSGTVAFDASGSYVGDNGTVSRTVGPNATVDINSVGTDVYGPNSSNVFNLLSTISTTMTTNPSAVSGQLAQLDTAMTTISNVQGLAGAKYSRVQSTQTVASNNTLALKSQLSDLQDIDLADMAIKVSTADASYQASLATTAKIRQTSLLDFLR
ncbi:MAG: flagellar hook-associated protein 3 [Frankiales bacterium]|nr:flagellar hook-associated protein 3 [Frankiales bacterium]